MREPDGVEEWGPLLDRLEDEADRLEAAAEDPDALEALLQAGAAAIPQPATPLPRHLAARAQAVLERIRAAEVRLVAASRLCAVVIEQTAPRSTSPSPRFIDARA